MKEEGTADCISLLSVRSIHYIDTDDKGCGCVIRFVLMYDEFLFFLCSKKSFWCSDGPLCIIPEEGLGQTVGYFEVHVVSGGRVDNIIIGATRDPNAVQKDNTASTGSQPGSVGYAGSTGLIHIA